MSAAPVCLEASDAVEIAELLDFLADVCGEARPEMSAILHAFVGRRYDAHELAADCRRLCQAIGPTGP